jgi:hypothetical protein
MNDKAKLPTNKNFGIVFSILFLVIGLYLLFFNNDFKIWLILLSIIFLFLGIINSIILTPLNLLWFKFGILLGKIITPLVMALVFFGLVTPIGLAMKLFNKDLLRLKKKKIKSYWIKKSDKSEMKNQF